jgi:YhcH/YjgK/YiaL family protein
LDYLSKTDFSVLEDGKRAIEGAEIYALIMTYSTEPESQRSFEVHQKYLDVQFILHGWEIIFWAPRAQLSPIGAYSPEKDVRFLSGEARARLQLTAGTFAIFYQEDAHKPNCTWNGPQQVRKVVVKVQVE